MKIVNMLKSKYQRQTNSLPRVLHFTLLTRAVKSFGLNASTATSRAESSKICGSIKCTSNFAYWCMFILFYWSKLWHFLPLPNDITTKSFAPDLQMSDSLCGKWLEITISWQAFYLDSKPLHGIFSCIAACFPKTHNYYSSLEGCLDVKEGFFNLT